jgi:choline dehydrogenase-like flavoprotein
MSALADLVAALLPPEEGGPDPERVAGLASRLISRMPFSAQAALAGTLLTLESLSLARAGRTLANVPPERRAELLDQVARHGGSVAIDAVRSLVLLAHGADAHAEEIAAVGAEHTPVRPDLPLAIVPATELPRSVRCEAVVVGSGAGGAFAARALARAGLDVVIVEEGEHWGVERIRATHPLQRFSEIYRDGGATFAIGNPPIALPVGRGVGGTTLVNSGTCYRPPEAVAGEWHRRLGLALAEPGALAARLADVEATLAVAPASFEVLGRNGELALAGAGALGWKAGPLARNAPGCRGACQCAIGCPNNAKAGVHLNALPEACAAGASIVSGLRVERVSCERGRATGIVGHAVARSGARRGGEELRIEAPLVVISAGAVSTPPLLRRSGLAGHPQVGRRLSIHPSVGVTASFEEEVRPWSGVMQSAGIEELHERHGILIEATSAPPGMGVVAAAGYGAHLLGRLARASHTATLGGMIADVPSGRVIGSRRPLVTYRLSHGDAARVVFAVGAMARVMLAAGAEEVELGGGAPPVQDVSELDRALEQVDHRRLRLAAFHPTGTVAAGANGAVHPVDPEGRLRGVTGVWVADASILPSCPGVNPQISVMSLAAGVGEAAARSGVGVVRP